MNAIPALLGLFSLVILAVVGGIVWTAWLDHRDAVHERQMLGAQLWDAGARPLTPGTHTWVKPPTPTQTDAYYLTEQELQTVERRLWQTYGTETRVGLYADAIDPEQDR